jgi:hypothetical protein
MTPTNAFGTEIQEISKAIRELRAKKLAEVQRHGPLVQRKLDVLDLA